MKIGNDVQVAVKGEFELGAGKHYKSLLGVWWGTGVGGGLILNGKPWLGRGAAAEIGHMVINAAVPAAPAAAAAAWRPTPVGWRWRSRRAGGQEGRQDRPLPDHGGARPRPAHQRRLGARTQARGRSRHEAGRPRGEGARRRDRFGGQPDRSEAVIIGGGLGDRFGEKYVSRIAKRMHPHLFVADRPPAMQVAALGDLGGAVGAALLVDK